MKPCIRCGATKPLSEFYTHPRMGDGHLNKCKECCRSDARRRHYQRMEDPAWREAERERGREKAARNGHLYPKRTPEQRSAHTKVAAAIRSGRLIPAMACQRCGHDFSEYGREAHHPDYGRPLDVEWLCRRCHRKHHRSVA